MISPAAMLALYLTYLSTFPGFVLRGPPATQPAHAATYQQFASEHGRQAPQHFRQ